MARKTFISYKYSEACELRDQIIEALGDDAQYYQGETSESPDLTDTSTENIRRNLRDMMYSTSVTIVIISPEMKKSDWISWELEYCLKEINRNDRKSKANGVVAVIQKLNGSYKWFINNNVQSDNCKTISYNENLVPDIIKKNRDNQNPKEYSCAVCKTISSETGSYISYVKEEDFLEEPNYYIEKAYEKSDSTNYVLKKKGE